MIVDKMVPPKRLMAWVLMHAVWLSIWASAAVCIYEFTGLASWLVIPWLPVSLIGTAVAFYVGFKNNSAYDRMWEARKIWGAIVNSSRARGSAIKSYVSNQFTPNDVSASELKAIHKRLIYRHIAWLYALRSQLLVVKNWEHAAQGGKTGRTAQRFQREFGVGLIDDEITKNELHLFIPADEFERTVNFHNTATQLIDQQSISRQSLHDRRANPA